MPLLGKIVVIKRNGEDGTEFPLTAACLFGRKLDCDIRIQLPQVSKEHCRIEQNENKELILTNLSSVNPTRINGEILQQSERLKDGDLITIIDRSFRFQYPPPPTPKKKRLSTPRKNETVKVLQDQRVISSPAATEKKSEHLSDTCLKDGSNLPTQDQSAEDAKTTTENTASPFSDLYNMVKRDLASKPQWKSATPTSKPPVSKEEPKKVSAAGTENELPVTPQSAKKRRRSSTAKFVSGRDVLELSDHLGNFPADVKITTPADQNATEKQKRRSQGLASPVCQGKTAQNTPQTFTPQEVAQQIVFDGPSTKQTPKSPRRSGSTTSLGVTPKEPTTPQNLSEPIETEEAQIKHASRTSPRTNAGKRFQVQDVLNEIQSTMDSDHSDDVQTSRRKHKMDDLPVPAAKRKRVSFGGQLSPELFDKRLPPDSPLRRGATPGRRSLSFFQRPQSLLRRASTIGLMGFRRGTKGAESSVKSASPKGLVKTPSPAKKSPVSKAKTPSPKTSKTPAASRSASPKTPAASRSASPKTPSPRTPAASRSASPKTPAASSRSASPKTPSPKTPAASSRSASPKTPAASSRSASPKTPSPKTPAASSRSASPTTPKSASQVPNSSLNMTSTSVASLLTTPTTRGRFSVSIIDTPSPVASQETAVVEESLPVVEEPQECVTPKMPVKRRSSLKASSHKTPKSSLQNMVRSRRSGASLANFKVVSSWADIVKFGQARSHLEGGTRTKAAKPKAAKQTKVTKLKTPARRLVNHTSTGHADSPATIVVGKAYLRSTNPVVAAPKVICNLALRKKDMNMDEDLTGVADIFKTPANSRRKSIVKKIAECTETPAVGHTPTNEMSVMMTPEESGEMMVSPISVASTARRRGLDAVTRLLQDDRNGSLIEELDASDSPASETLMSSKEAEPRETVKTPQRQSEPSECLTGVKRLMRTPKQKAEPIEDLRGKLLKTPRGQKQTLEESLDGVKELLKTPKQKASPVEDMDGLKELIATPVVKDGPVVTDGRSARTPEDKSVQDEDLTGVKRLMKTPKVKGAPVEDSFGLKRLLRTPKEKREAVEDLTGIQQMMKTPKQKVQHAEDLGGVEEMMKTHMKPAEEDLTGIKEMIEIPKQKEPPVMVEPAGVKESETPKRKEQTAEDLESVKQTMKTPKQKSPPVEEQFPVGNDFEIMMTPTPSAVEVVESLQILAEPSSSLIGNESLEVQEMEKMQTSDATDAAQEPEENICPVEDKDAEAAAVVQDVSPVIIDAETKTSQDVDDRVPVTTTESVSVDPMIEETVQAVESTQVSASVKGRRGRGKALANVVEDIPTHSPARTSSRGKTSKTEEKTALKPRRGTKSADVQAVLNTEACVVPEPLVSSKARRGRKARHESEIQPVGTETEEPEAVSDEPAVPEPPVESNTRARRGRTANKETQKMVQTEALVTEESNRQPSEPVINASEPETSAEIEVPVKSSARSRRGKVSKKSSNTEQVQDSETSTATETQVTGSEAEMVPGDEASSEPQPADTEAPVKANTRSRRGKVTKKAISKVATVEAPKPTTDLEESDKSAEAVKSSTRSRRGKAATEEAPKSRIEDMTEVSIINEEARGGAEKEIVVPVKSTAGSRRGRANTKESSQVEEVTRSIPAIKADLNRSEGEVEAVPASAEVSVGSTSRSRRGRATQREATEVNKLSDNIDAVVVKSGHGRRVKPASSKEQELIKPQAESIAKVTDTAEVPVEPVLKKVRGGRRATPSKAQGSEESQNQVKDVPETEPPVVRSARGTKSVIVQEEAEVPQRRGRSATAVEVLPPALKPTRGRKAALKPEPKKVTDVSPAAVEEADQVTDSVIDLEPAAEEADRHDKSSNQVAAKRGPGRAAKSSKASSKNASVDKVKEPDVVDSESKGSTSKKAVNWNSDLVTWKNIEEFEPDTEEEPPVKSRKGRVTKKQKEPEKPKSTVEETVVTVRSGRTGASAGSKPSKAVVPKRGQKRKEVEAPAEEMTAVEVLPKRRRGKAADVETPAKEAEETKPARGRRKAAPAVRTQAEDPVEEVTTRRGTRAQKMEESDVAAAPVRRTRRK